MIKQYCENGHLLSGDEDLQEMEDGRLEIICPECVRLDEIQDRVNMSRCADDYPASVRFSDDPE